MLRQIHSLPGLIAGLLLALVAITGAILAIEPARERFSAPVVEAGDIDVATFAGLIQSQYSEIDKIRQTPSGSIVVTFFEGEKAGANIVDPHSFKVLGPYAPAGFTRFVTNLHRTLLMGDAGRITVGIGAALMLLLTLSGTMMLAVRLGGYRALLRPARGTPVQKWHADLGRLAMIGLLITSLSGIYLSLSTFEILPDGSNQSAPTASGSGGPRRAVQEIGALKGIDLKSLRELTFPYSADLTDTYTLTTGEGVTQIDAATGEALGFEPHGAARRIHEVIYMLHTGQGLWPLALLLGLCALAVPFFAFTGGLIWWQRQKASVRIPRNASAGAAETILLVGTEGNSTWGFAATLHAALVKSGQSVHAAPMNALAKSYPNARRMIILTATYGDGDAPASAKGFLARLETGTKPLPVAVLGFGDRAFPKFCRYAEAVGAALEAKGFPAMLDLHRIDRQSAQDFAAWGRLLGAAMGIDLTLNHVAARPATRSFALETRTDYGADVQAATAILRFTVPQEGSGNGFPRFFRRPRLPAFEAGDLVGILPPGSHVPRFYSLASSRKDGFLEICVRKQPGGLCSGFLHDLKPGERINAFIRPNPAFRPSRARTPLILVGAGAGIAPLMGFIRQNARCRPVHLYWGGRSPKSDFLYENELAQCLRDRRLTALHAAFSRTTGGRYVQSEILANATPITEMIGQGAEIMVCGGRDMGQEVARAVNAILGKLGSDLSTLRQEGRYCEDIY